jgi:AcrR family transcriptional regulator
MLETPKSDRVSRRREATKAEILGAAWDLVGEVGLAGLSLRDLAARVGMRAPSLYQYFDSKHAIYDAMFQQAAQDMLEIRSVEVAPATLRADLLRAAHQFFDLATANAARAQLLFQRTLPGFEPSPAAYAPATELINRLQQAFINGGITHPDALDAWTSLLSGLVNQQLANDPGGDRYKRLVDRFVDMFLADFGPKKKGK